MQVTQKVKKYDYEVLVFFFSELIGTETRYAQKLSLLPDLVEDYPEKQRDGAVFSLLRDMTGQIRRVLALHQDLRAALEGAEKKRLPLVLAEFKSRLLVYGPFIEQVFRKVFPCSVALKSIPDRGSLLPVLQRLEDTQQHEGRAKHQQG